MKHNWGRSSRPIMDNKGRPQFEKMLGTIEQARRLWDMPGLRGYSLVLLRMVEMIAVEDADDSEKVSSHIEVPHLAQEAMELLPAEEYQPQLGGHF